MSASDPRVTLRRSGRAAAALEGLIEAQDFIEPRRLRVRASTVMLRASPSPDAEPLDQLLFGEGFDALEEEEGRLFGQATRDGYVGWAPAESFAEATTPPTHRVSALRAYTLAEPRVRSRATTCLSMNALLAVDAVDGAFVHAVDAGWIAHRHTTPLDGAFERDWAGVAERYLETPYRWGGRDSLGLDCSGLVQAALYACGRGCGRDSDMQRALGRPLESEPLERGDLVFWRGHVGVMLDSARLLHANAHHMAVAAEPLDQACARIRANDGGEVLERRRL